MALPSTRTEFREYCLRELGKPVIEINVADEQIEDRIDEALYFWSDYHFEGAEKVYLKHQISGSVIQLGADANGTFETGETITGANSGAQAIVLGQDSNTQITFRLPAALSATTVEFIEGETITGSTSNATGVIATSNSSVEAISYGDIDRRWIPIVDPVLSVVQVWPTSSGLQSGDLFNITYQLRLYDLWNFTSTTLVPYTIAMQHISLMQMLLVGQAPIRYQRHTNKLYIDWDWDVKAPVGQWIIVECYRTLDPTAYPDVWSDRVLRNYATQLIKRQWGSNLMKFQGITMPGGITLNGEKIFGDADARIQEMEKEMQLKYELPPSMQVG